MDANRIATYSFLAHINNESKSIKDLCDIFVPLVKRVIAFLYKQGTLNGLIIDIKLAVDKTYGIDMPYTILRDIVRNISSEVNKTNTNDFIFYDDGSFMIKKFAFAEYEEVLSKQQLDIEMVNESYQEYLKQKNIDIDSQPSVFEFLDRNRVVLSSFFAGKETNEIDLKYLIQAEFINTNRQNIAIYSILKKIYLGSIISAYLESDYEVIEDNNIELLLDTNFIISILNLHSIEASHTCMQLIKLCKRLGYKLSILDFTIEEIRNFLNRKANEFSSGTFFSRLHCDDIYAACERLRFTKTDLMQLASNLEIVVKDRFAIEIIRNTTQYINEAKVSPLYEIFNKRHNNPQGALHDVTAIIYVKKIRGKEVKNFQDANSWFVSDTNNQPLRLYQSNGSLYERIDAQNLLNILWLSSPCAHLVSEQIAEAGLTVLVAMTIDSALPNSRDLKELDENIQKYGKDEIKPADFVRISNMIANRTLQNIKALNDIAEQSPDEFLNMLSDFSQQVVLEEENQKSQVDEIKAALESKIQLQSIDICQYEQEIIEIKKAGIQAISDSVDSKRNHLKDLMKLQETIKNRYIQINDTANNLIQQKETYCNRGLCFLIISIIIILLIDVALIFLLGWNVMEQYTSIGGLMFFISGYVFFATTRTEFSPAGYKSFLELKYDNKHAADSEKNKTELLKVSLEKKDNENSILTLKHDIKVLEIRLENFEIEDVASATRLD